MTGIMTKAESTWTAIRTAASAATIVALALTAAAAQGQTSDPSFITMNSFVYSGSGCPPGSVSYDLSADREAVTLIFSNFQVETDAAQVANCSVNMSLTVPPGWQYAVYSIDTRGYADIQAGASGYHTSSYEFNGGPATSLGYSPYGGPYTSNYFDHDEINLATNNWSACNNAVQNLGLYLQMGVTGTPSAQAMMSIDSADGSLAHEVGVRWRHCPSTDANRRFVESLYADVLGRWAGDWEIDGWYAKLPAMDRTAMGLAFWGSAEHRGYEVAADYILFLNRAASAAEIQAGAQRMAGGVTSDQMIAGLAASPEFFKRYGSTAQGFVAGLFYNVLGRAGSPAEINSWLVRARANRTTTAQQFVHLPEARRHQVATFYQRYLNRAGSPAEWNGWVTGMNNKANAQEYVVSSILGSAEYYNMQR